MAKKTTAKRSPGKAQTKSPKTAARKGSGGSKSGSGTRKAAGRRKQPEGIKGAGDALLKLLESPLVTELLAVGASAALAALVADRFGRSDEARGTRRAIKGAVQSAASAIGDRIADEFDDIKQSAKKARA